MRLLRCRLKLLEFQNLAGHRGRPCARTPHWADDAKQHSLQEMTLRKQPLRGVDSSHLSFVAATEFSLRSKFRRPQPCTDRIAVFPATSSTARHNTASRGPC